VGHHGDGGSQSEAGALAARTHAKATTATIRAQLITVPAPLGTAPDPAPADRLALGARLAGSAHRRHRPTNDVTTQPHRARPETTWKTRTDRPITHARRHSKIDCVGSVVQEERDGGSRLRVRRRGSPAAPGG
jgi:hypothetical protein